VHARVLEGLSFRPIDTEKSGDNGDPPVGARPFRQWLMSIHRFDQQKQQLRSGLPISCPILPSNRSSPTAYVLHYDLRA